MMIWVTLLSLTYNIRYTHLYLQQAYLQPVKSSCYYPFTTFRNNFSVLIRLSLQRPVLFFPLIRLIHI